MKEKVEKMATIKIKDITESKIVRLVDLSEDSINKIAEVVVQKIAEPMRHGHWIAHDMSIKDVPTEACSECCEWSYGYNEPYCPNCGAKMDEVEDGDISSKL